jgi:hypothetical protein
LHYVTAYLCSVCVVLGMIICMCDGITNALLNCGIANTCERLFELIIEIELSALP